MAVINNRPKFACASEHTRKLTVCISHGTQVNGRIALSTKTLEPEPGDMIKNPQKVYDMAEVRRKQPRPFAPCRGVNLVS